MAQMAATLQHFMQNTNATNTQINQAINDITGTLSKISTSLSTLKKGKFSAQAQHNPQVYKQSQVHSVEMNTLNW